MKASVHLYAVGAFGSSVASVLRVYIPDLTQTNMSSLGDQIHQPIRRSIFTVIAVEAPSDEDSAAFSLLCHANNVNLIPLVLQPECLLFGPVNRTRGGPCWSCAMRRYNQYTPPNDAGTTSTGRTQRESQQCGIVDRMILMLVASAIYHISFMSRLQTLPAGRIWRMDLRSREIVSHNVVGIHRCLQCGLGRDGGQVSTKEMRDSVSYLFEGLDEFDRKNDE